MSNKIPITVAKGDGIGPEIMDACLRIFDAAGANVTWEHVDVGEKVYLTGNTTGLGPEVWESLRRTKVFYKAPITTPQGGGYKSLNVTTRKTLGLYANVRPCVSYHPFVDTKYPGMDVVIVRENEEDLYAGIEYRQSDDVYSAIKLITRPGSEKIIRYAFEYAKQNKRKKVTCFSKDNIMKMTDGLFHKVFDEIAADYPDITNEFWIVDIGAAKLADSPELFDVLVLPNLYGDILSDVAAQIAGSVGLAGSANIGTGAAMFEAIHGSAPRRAGQNLANPSGLFLGGVMMMVHIGQTEVAEAAHNAWLRTIEEGVHTYDMFQEGKSREKVGTKEFGDAVIARLGKKPETFKPVSYAGGSSTPRAGKEAVQGSAKKELTGVDVVVHWTSRDADKLAAILQPMGGNMKLELISNRGQKIWPDGSPETLKVDQCSCRFLSSGKVTHEQVIELLGKVAAAKIDFVKIENLYTFDGERGFTAAQGE
jgi:isocitrate dehydrogenase